jgi:hypothetical protein
MARTIKFLSSNNKTRQDSFATLIDSQNFVRQPQSFERAIEAQAPKIRNYKSPMLARLQDRSASRMASAETEHQVNILHGFCTSRRSMFVCCSAANCRVKLGGAAKMFDYWGFAGGRCRD